MPSNALLIQELNTMKAQLNVQIATIERAHRADCERNPGVPETVYALRYPSGQYVMPELLAAKAAVLNGLAVLKAAK